MIVQNVSHSFHEPNAVLHGEPKATALIEIYHDVVALTASQTPNWLFV